MVKKKPNVRSVAPAAPVVGEVYDAAAVMRMPDEPYTAMRDAENPPATATGSVDNPGTDAKLSKKPEDVPTKVPANSAGDDTKPLKKDTSSTATAMTTTTPGDGAQEDDAQPKEPKEATPTSEVAAENAVKTSSTRHLNLSNEHQDDVGAPKQISLQTQRAQYMEQVEALQRVLEKQVELTGNNPLRKEMVVMAREE
eukprot:CAMPEP_0118936972 /NCGR_PEP_ID=MMETSP1169-20130426/21242_1 /TAXON_ID=36882 /ORGANISM="Pyramimonas obovata, Strain CCMP722" /LENGTH=196 /DNA_ID=CAMNT_0006880449 /DNA_START=114 /DNA_END=701 /DNA_ORIENTATION=-